MPSVKSCSVRQIGAVACYALRISLRAPLALLALFAALGLMWFMPALSAFNLGEVGSLARDSALAIYAAGGMLLAAALPLTVMRGTFSSAAQLEFVKPIGRGALFIGRYLGWAAMLSWYALAGAAGVLLADEIGKFAPELDLFLLASAVGVAAVAAGVGAWLNWRCDASFATAVWLVLPPALFVLLVVNGWLRIAPENLALVLKRCSATLQASALLMFAFWLMLAVVCCLAARLPLVWVLGGYGVALAGGMFTDYAAESAPWLWVKKLAMAFPAWQDFWMIDVLDGAVIGGYLLSAFVFVVIYCAGLLLLGTTFFMRSEPQ